MSQYSLVNFRLGQERKRKTVRYLPSVVDTERFARHPSHTTSNDIKSITMSSSITTVLRALPRTGTTSIRSFSIAARRMAEGDTGAPRAQGDAFNKREKANEDYYVRQEEAKKLEALKKKIADQEQALEKDRAEAEKLGKK
ncbi:unnamed protein product [Zymoseptoria tritici ST99CH_3D7]|uniref:ATPase inhibitor, mitochondrial n=1 Tax=Zymoseptoria tritici (strain ST99CH_3D7) TaxID=1276538 RepID=A0A1X7RWZ5_ZYMT9|nr:unnamed protein product [Zymoseptoria tritici ST99CH_3D7]